MNYKDLIKGDTLKIAESLVPISDFSKGKTSRIFDNVQNHNSEYIVLKNNKPAAVVVPMDTYKEVAEKAYRFDMLLEQLEERRLAKLAESRVAEEPETYEFFDVVRKLGFTEEEILNGFEDVELE